MAPCPPPFAIGAALLTARDLVRTLRSGAADADTLLEYCRAMRIAGVGKLLLTARPRELFADLERAGQALAWYLGPGRGRLPTGRATPFFDAVACGDGATAGAIANAAARQWTPGAEYEDDFLYLRFLMDLVAPTVAPATAGAALVRWADLAETLDPRLDCCLALRDGDSAGFDRAVRHLVLGDRAADEELAGEDRLDPDAAATTAHVHVEALALVFLAQRRGLEVADELPHVPALARRLDLRTPLAAGAWQEVEALGIVA